MRSQLRLLITSCCSKTSGYAFFIPAFQQEIQYRCILIAGVGSLI